MKNLSISRILTGAIPMMVVCVVLALSASAVAQSSHTLANSLSQVGEDRILEDNLRA